MCLTVQFWTRSLSDLSPTPCPVGLDYETQGRGLRDSGEEVAVRKMKGRLKCSFSQRGLFYSRLYADHLALGGTQPAWWSQPGTFFFFPNSDSDCSRFPIGSPSDQTVAPLPVITRPPNRSACCVEDVTVFTVGERSIQAGKEEKMGVGRYYLMGWSFSWGQCLSSADDCVDGCATG